MSEPIKAETISDVLGPYGHIENVRENWPLIFAALRKLSIDDTATQIATIATVGVETGRFAPIRERGGPAYFQKLYDGRADLGNVNAGDGAKFYGRGYVQITGRSNYTNYGREIGVDLVATPDRALEPGIGAEILALFFRDKRIPALAEAGKWETVRRRVNGGLNGWDRFSAYVAGLSKALTVVVGDVEIKT